MLKEDIDIILEQYADNDNIKSLFQEYIYKNFI